MPGAVHPSLHYLLRGSLAPRDVFTRAAVRHPLLGQGGGKAAAVWAGMGKRLLGFSGSDLRGGGSPCVNRQRGEPRLGPLLVDQIDHLLGKGRIACTRR